MVARLPLQGLLPCDYLHAVFTLPPELRGISAAFPTIMLGSLLQAASDAVDYLSLRQSLRRCQLTISSGTFFRLVFLVKNLTPRHNRGVSGKKSRQRPTFAFRLSSALAGLTAVFGMGTGVTLPVWSPGKDFFAGRALVSARGAFSGCHSGNERIAEQTARRSSQWTD
jgi:hypothetical protein